MPSEVAHIHRQAARVLHVAPRYLPDLGGIETHVHEVGVRLNEQADLSLVVAATDRLGEHPAFSLSEGLPILRRRAWPRNKDYYVAPGLARVIAGGGWDLVHIQGVHTAVPIIAMLAAQRAGLPYVVTFHSGGHSSSLRVAGRRAQWRVLGPLLRGANALVAVSRSEQVYFAEALRIDPASIPVIRNGGSLPPAVGAIRPVPGRIVSCGRLEKYKGHHRAIDALPEIRRRIPEAHLQILGAGPYESELRARAYRLGVADAVTIELVPPNDRLAMAHRLAAASVFVALSDYEAHPVAVMEALALGVPVLGYNVAGVADLVADGLVTGVHPGAPAGQVAGMIANAFAAPRVVHANFPTWDEAADSLAALYRDVLTPSRSPSLASPHLSVVGSGASGAS